MQLAIVIKGPTTYTEYKRADFVQWLPWERHIGFSSGW